MHFQYRAEIFYKVFIIDGPIGKSKYYAIRVEFQIRENPHTHSFIWIINAPRISSENMDEYTMWVDGLVKANLPDDETDSTLFELLNQNHVENLKMIIVLFFFTVVFTNRTIIAQPLSSSLTSLKKKIFTQEKRHSKYSFCKN